MLTVHLCNLFSRATGSPRANAVSLFFAPLQFLLLQSQQYVTNYNLPPHLVCRGVRSHLTSLSPSFPLRQLAVSLDETGDGTRTWLLG